MEILLAGSSGTIGTALLKSLVHQGHEVTCLTRPTSHNSNSIKTDQLSWNPPEVGIDLTNKNFDCVINLCGEPVAGKRWKDAQKKILYSSRVDTTKLLAAAIANMEEPPKIFLNASAIGVYGEAGSKILEETAAIIEAEEDGDKSNEISGNFMAELCRDWEAATNLATEKGIQTFNLRIGLVVDGSARFVKLQKPLFRLGLGGWLGKPRSWISWVSLVDVVESINFILNNPEKLATGSSAGKGATPVNVVSPTPVTAKRFAKAFGKALRRPVIFRIPKLAPQVLMGRELVNALLQSARVMPKALMDAGYEFRHANILSAFRHSFDSKSKGDKSSQ